MAGTSTFSAIQVQADTTQILYNAQSWTLVSLRLEGGGTVRVGQQQELTPVSAGKGVILTSDIRYFLLGPGDIIFAGSDSLTVIGVAIHPLNFLCK